MASKNRRYDSANQIGTDDSAPSIHLHPETEKSSTIYVSSSETSFDWAESFQMVFGEPTKHLTRISMPLSFFSLNIINSYIGLATNVCGTSIRPNRLNAGALKRTHTNCIHPLMIRCAPLCGTQFYIHWVRFPHLKLTSSQVISDWKAAIQLSMNDLLRTNRAIRSVRMCVRNQSHFTIHLSAPQQYTYFTFHFQCQKSSTLKSHPTKIHLCTLLENARNMNWYLCIGTDHARYSMWNI